ncbi:Major Facilitator Superfamily (MFS) [Achlya hypogyna]|uniref:Major Facilitator Superfamily (MFS) n=1 Tax=Achlya hypogyna TaxID=1202772 RepID=A0A1V9YFB6_ACHHY|nr:Major Facilitator Superfamily (MFS) [Achlya hypogyna]
MHHLLHEVRRAASVAAGVVIYASLGSSYSISAWNGQLKDALNMTQPEIAFVSSCYSFGMYNTIWAGFFHDRFGTRWSMIVALLLLTACYALAAYLTAAPWLPKWYIALCFGSIGQAGGFAVVAGLAANEGIYGGRRRGAVIGLLLATYSAGGAIFACVYHGVYDHDVAEFFRFMSFEQAVMALLGLLLLIPPPSRRIKLEDEDIPLLPPADDITLGALLADERFWLLFVPVMVGVGSALFVLNNIAFLLESYGRSSTLVPGYVSAFSVCNMGGRLAMGLISDKFAASRTRAWFLSAGVVFMMLTQGIFLFVPASYLVVPIVCAGLAEGCIFAMFPVVTRELFGAVHFGKNFGLISLANAVGFPLLLGPLSSFLYRWATPEGSATCFGPRCFTPTFLVMLLLCAVAFVASVRLQRHMHVFSPHTA